MKKLKTQVSGKALCVNRVQECMMLNVMEISFPVPLNCRGTSLFLLLVLRVLTCAGFILVPVRRWCAVGAQLQLWFQADALVSRASSNISCSCWDPWDSPWIMQSSKAPSSAELWLLFCPHLGLHHPPPLPFQSDSPPHLDNLIRLCGCSNFCGLGSPLGSLNLLYYLTVQLGRLFILRGSISLECVNIHIHIASVHPDSHPICALPAVGCLHASQPRMCHCTPAE